MGNRSWWIAHRNITDRNLVACGFFLVAAMCDKKIQLFFPLDTGFSCRTPTWCGIGNSSNSPALIYVLSRGSRKRKTGSHIKILSASSSQHTPANRNALWPLHWMWRILIYLQIELPNSTEAWSRLADSNCDHCGVNYSEWTFTLPALMSILYTSEPCRIGWARQGYNTLWVCC